MEICIKSALFVLAIAVLTHYGQAATINTEIREKRQAQPACAEVGKYCKYSTDCCSGLCLSFSYKCVSRPPVSPFEPVIISNNNNNVIPANTDDLVNRFGENSPTVGGAGSGTATTPRECAANGGYCQYNAQCCSRRCLSFSYKCVPDPHQHANPGFQNNNTPVNINQVDLTPNVFEVGQAIPGQGTIDDIVNRFGDQNPPPANTNVQGPPVLARPQQPDLVAAAPPADSGNCSAIGAQCEYSNQCCSKFCAVTSLNTRSCANRTESEFPVTGSSMVANRCLVIGATCYTHSECCSERCHNYLHQCVT